MSGSKGKMDAAQDRAADKAGLRKEIARNANADRVKDSGKVQIAALRRMAAKKGAK